MNFGYYLIVKTYKGIFQKTHTGNTHFIILPTNKKYLYLNIMAEDIETGDLLAGKIENIKDESYPKKVIKNIQNKFGFNAIFLEKISLEYNEKDKTLYYKTNDNTKYFPKKFSLEYSEKLSKEYNITMFFLKGNFKLELKEVGQYNFDFKMNVKTSMAKALAIKNLLLKEP